MRSRNIKPGFFKNEDLAKTDPRCRLLFAGLWGMADRDGRLEDRPARIRAEVFPYEPEVDVNGYLTVLSRLGMVIRYRVGEVSILQVTNWKRHQSPHSTEKKGELPEYVHGVTPLTVNSRLFNGGSQEDSLIPDSLIPDSPTPLPSVAYAPSVPQLELVTSENPERLVSVSETEKGAKKTAMTWLAYAQAYQDRWGVEPVRNAKVNGQLGKFVDRLGAAEAPAVAAFFVGSNRAVYVAAKHAVDLMLRDAEGLRTEWATGRRGTETAARQADRLGSNFQNGEDLKRELAARNPD